MINYAFGLFAVSTHYILLCGGHVANWGLGSVFFCWGWDVIVGRKVGSTFVPLIIHLHMKQTQTQRHQCVGNHVSLCYIISMYGCI